MPAPSLDPLQHPTMLRDLTVYAPAALYFLTPFRSFAELLLPATEQCASLAYVTYATDRPPSPGVAGVAVKRTMLVLVGKTELNRFEADMVQRTRQLYPNFSSRCLSDWNQLLREWVARMEGRESILDHAPEMRRAKAH